MERFTAQAFDLLQSSVGEVLAAARVLELLAQQRDVHPEAVRAAGAALDEAMQGIWAPLVWDERGDGAQPHGQQSPGYPGGPLQA